MTGLLIAVQFLTRLTGLVRRPVDEADLALALGYFPFVGFLIGIGLAIFDWLLQPIAPAPIRAVLLLTALTLVTGGAHLSELGEAGQVLVSGRSDGDRLPSGRTTKLTGAGVIAVSSVLLLKYAALEAMPFAWSAGTLLVAPILSRWTMVYAAVVYPHLGPEGVIRPLLRDGPGGRVLAAATLTATLLAFLFLFWRGAIAFGLIWGVSWLIVRYLRTKSAGLTRNDYGALNEIGEALLFIAIPALSSLEW